MNMSSEKSKRVIDKNTSMINNKNKKKNSDVSSNGSSYSSRRSTEKFVEKETGGLKPVPEHTWEAVQDAFHLEKIHVCGQATFSTLKHNSEECICRLKKRFDIKENLIRNILAYLYLLPKFRCNFIDIDVFRAHMIKRLHMSDLYYTDDLFKHIQAKNKDIMKCLMKKCPSDFELDKHLHVQSYAFFLCELIDNNIEFRAKLVFQINDILGKGYITKQDLTYIISTTQPIESLQEQDQDDDEHMSSIEFLVKEVAHKCGLTSKDSKMTFDDFAKLVKKDDENLEILGSCLPKRQHLMEFVNNLEKMTPFTILTKFRHERQSLLGSYEAEGTSETTESYIQSLYPIQLEFYF